VLRVLALLPLVVAVARAEGRECTCNQGQACYHQLRAPVSAPADPDPCPKCLGSAHENPPASWNDACWQSPRMPCFLRRHAASWGITCPLCVAKPCCGMFPNWRQCPECQGAAQEGDDAAQTQLAEALEGQRKIAGSGVQMAMSPRYVIVTDLPSVKIVTDRGSPRVVYQHELLHLFLQRAELARRDFEEVFGPVGGSRSVIGMFDSDGTRKVISKSWFGHQDTNLLYGSGRGALVGGLAGNGFAIYGRDDDDLHFRCRHMIGHLCISNYAGGNPHEKYLPQWLFRGAAHWLAKLHPRAVDFATFCSYEGVKLSGSGSNWDDKARKIAARGPLDDPVERMLQAATAKQMNYEMHIRAWSWFDVFTREEREPFVKLVRQLRAATEARVAMKDSFGQPPEVVDQRWRERVLGRRRDVEATNREKEKETDVEAATSRELGDIQGESDIHLLAGKIRGLDRCRNVRTARVLVELVDSKDSDRVREVIALVLARTNEAKVLDYLMGEGYERAGKLGRATLLRTFGETGHQNAIPLVRKALEESFWLCRANAARALALLGDRDSIAKLAPLAGNDPQPKVRIAAMDALAALGGDAKATLPLWKDNIEHSAWQVRTTTCKAFIAMGDRAAVEPLIMRLNREGGRIHEDIRAALKSLTGMDKPEWPGEKWLAWWTKEKKYLELEEKMREELAQEKSGEGGGDRAPEEKEPDMTGYAKEKDKPTEYAGIKIFARAVGFVLDISQSMEQGFRVSDAMATRLGRTYKGTTRIAVSKEELTAAIEGLDPRTRLNLVFFNDRVRVWKDLPIAATPQTKESAISAVKNAAVSGQTNHYDALKVILDMGGALGGWSAEFGDTPDTIFLLTDGNPTDGEITKSDELLSWLRERNRFARLRIHVIAMGTTGVDLEYLSKLATENEGTFVHLTGDY